MDKLYEVEYIDAEPKKEYDTIIKKVIEECYKTENLLDSNLYISITLTNSNYIKEINKKYRNIDKETDVLSFPMFEKEELPEKIKQNKNIDILGDMVISLEKIESQAQEYGHSFEREFAYIIVHSFYHLMGYDHIEENDKKIMREKEENILNKLNITRD